MLHFLAVLARRWRFVVVWVLVCVAAAAGVTWASTPTYRATAQLFVALDTANTALELNSAANFSSQRVKSYPDLVASPLVLNPVIEDLGLDRTAVELSEDVSAEVPPGTVLIEVRADDPSPTLAAAIANAVAASLADQIELLDTTNEGETSPVRVTVTRAAMVPTDPRTPIPLLNLGLGLFLGLGLGVISALVREALDTTLKDDNDVHAVTGLPTLASVPVNAEVSRFPLVRDSGSNPVWGESYRKLRTNLSFIDPDNPPQTILVTSALPGEGKTLTAANLAETLGQNGKRTLLIETDLRRPGVGKLLKLDTAIGLTNAIVGQTAPRDTIQQTADFDVLTSGQLPPNPSELLGSHAFAKLLEDLKVDYDRIVIDTPPLVAVTDAAVVAPLADAVVVVCRSRRTKRQDLRRALLSLRAVDATVAGVVLNQVAMSAGTYYQYEYTSAADK